MLLIIGYVILYLIAGMIFVPIFEKLTAFFKNTVQSVDKILISIFITCWPLVIAVSIFIYSAKLLFKGYFWFLRKILKSSIFTQEEITEIVAGPPVEIPIPIKKEIKTEPIDSRFDILDFEE